MDSPVWGSKHVETDILIYILPQKQTVEAKMLIDESRCMIVYSRPKCHGLYLLPLSCIILFKQPLLLGVQHGLHDVYQPIVWVLPEKKNNEFSLQASSYFRLYKIRVMDLAMPLFAVLFQVYIIQVLNLYDTAQCKLSQLEKQELEICQQNNIQHHKIIIFYFLKNVEDTKTQDLLLNIL